MAKEKILIVVKTYPTISKNYTEIACTAGFRENGSWIRLYPIPFRLLDTENQYKKYQWIEADVDRNWKDPRPESYRILDKENIKLLDKISTEHQWKERRKIILSNSNKEIYTNLHEIIDLAHQNKISLAVFKPKKILDFVIEPVDPEWSQDKINDILNDMQQKDLFGNYNSDDFKIMPKIPYKFSYKFCDNAGKESTLMIEDWEIGQLYLNCEKDFSKEQAIDKVRQKYIDDFAKTKDLYLFLGTTYPWHIRKAKNPFVIIGTFHPPRITQLDLF